MPLGRTIALCLLICCAGIAGYAQYDAQARMRPFDAPDRLAAARAKAQRLKVALRFGYLAENKEAESLRGRTEYNQEGFPTVQYAFSPTGTIEEKRAYSYAADGSTVETAFFEFYKQDAAVESFFYRLDPQQQILEYKHTDVKGRIYRVGYAYDAEGRILSQQAFEIDGLPGGQEIFARDSLGRLIEIIKYDLSNTPVGRKAFSYDDAGRMATESHYMQGDFLLFSFAYTYDEKGRLVRKEKFGRNAESGPRQTETWRYDATGRILEHSTQIAGEDGLFKETFAYDFAGRKTRARSYETDGNIFQWYVYTYDSTGAGSGYDRYNPNGTVDLVMRTRYDADRKLVEARKHYPDGSGDHQTEYRYDELGLPMEEIHRNFGEEEAVYWFVYERY